MIKLNVVLAKTDHLAASFRKLIEEYGKYFRGDQGDFKGEKRTYTPREGTIDAPGKRLNKVVVTTVKEKLDWFESNVKEYVDSLFSLEATNASGTARAELIVEGVSWGTFSSLELLRLKTLLENGSLESMYSSIPTRSDAEEWRETTSEQYAGREIYETPAVAGVEKTTVKESYILRDPNIREGDQRVHTPQIAVKDTVLELGDYTHQRFSGEYSHRKRAEILRKRTLLINAVIGALKTANDVEVIPSGITSQKIFSYLHE